MKKTDKTALTAAVFAAAMNLAPISAAGADTEPNYDPDTQFEETVYGPPVDYSATTTAQSPICVMTTQRTTELPLPVYGPPYIFTTAATAEPDTQTTAATVTTTEFVPEREDPYGVYGPMPLQGDVNGDFRVDAFDLVALRQMYAEGGHPIGYYESERADLNADREISMADLVMLSRYLLGQIDNFKIQPETTAAHSAETTITETTYEVYPVYGPMPSFDTETTAADADPD